jgi:cobalt/nickel transport system permease protein
MHTSEGVLQAPVLVAGACLAAAGLAVGLKKMDYQRLPQTALLAAAFFVASLVSAPLGPAKVHLVLNGLLGILLGWGAFPALFVGLALQAALFQFGGFTTLGVNTFNMAFPALVCFWLFARLVKNGPDWGPALGGFAAGFVSVLGSSLLVALSLVSAGEQFANMARLIVLAHLPVMVLEGLLTAAVVDFIRRVRPAMLV